MLYPHSGYQQIAGEGAGGKTTESAPRRGRLARIARIRERVPG